MGAAAQSYSPCNNLLESAAIEGVAGAGERGVRKSIFLFLTKKDRRSKSAIEWRCWTDLNRRMRVLQTLALPLGYSTIWSGLRGSNSLPPPWQGGALPDELKPHFEMAQLRSLVYYTKLKGVCQEKISLFSCFLMDAANTAKKVIKMGEPDPNCNEKRFFQRLLIVLTTKEKCFSCAI